MTPTQKITYITLTLFLVYLILFSYYLDAFFGPLLGLTATIISLKLIIKIYLWANSKK